MALKSNFCASPAFMAQPDNGHFNRLNYPCQAHSLCGYALSWLVEFFPLSFVCRVNTSSRYSTIGHFMHYDLNLVLSRGFVNALSCIEPPAKREIFKASWYGTRSSAGGLAIKQVIRSWKQQWEGFYSWKRGNFSGRGHSISPGKKKDALFWGV